MRAHVQDRPGEAAAGAPLWVALAWATALGVDLLLLLNIDTSSLWMDELYTAFYSNPELSLPRVLSERMALDGHPPLYYLLVYGWQQLFGSSPAALRGLSLLAAVLLQGVLFFGTRRLLSAEVRAALLAFASLSPVYLRYAAEARSYPVLLLVTTLACLEFHRLWRAHGPEGAARVWGHVRLGALGLAMALMHSYGLLLAGGLILTLLTRARSWRQAVAPALTGAAVLILSALQVAWTLSHMIYEPQHTNFTREPGLLLKDTVIGLYQPFGWRESLLIMAVAAGIGLARAAGGLSPVRLMRAAIPYLAPAWPFISAILITVAAAILTSILWIPSLGARSLTPLAAPAWLALACLAQAVLDRGGLAARRGVAATCVLVAGYGALHLGSLRQPWKEEWRASAAFVDGIEACRGDPLPIVGVGRLEWQDSFFYGYYRHLEGGTFIDLDREPLGADDPAQRSAELRKLDRRAADCPVLLWSVHMLDRAQVEALAGQLDLPQLGYKAAEIIAFSNREPLALRGERADAFVVLGR